MQRAGLFDVAAHREGLDQEFSKLRVWTTYTSIARAAASPHPTSNAVAGSDGGSAAADAAAEGDGDTTREVFADPSARLLRKRLEMYLKVFCEVTGPRQLYCHQLLYILYHELAGKADTGLARLAFDCLCTYKSKSILPYKDLIASLFDDKKIRDALVTFSPSHHAAPSVSPSAPREGSHEPKQNEAVTAVNPEHRAELIPLLVKVLYGRMLARIKGGRSARDLSIAR